MCDALDVLCHTHAPFELDDPLPDTSRPTTPLPDHSRTLRRTISHASIDTIRPPKNKGIRRSINEIAENLKRKSEKKKKKDSSTQGVPKTATRDVTSNSKTLPGVKAASHGRKATSSLRDASHRPEEETVQADRLHSGVFSQPDLLLTLPAYKPTPSVDVPPLEEEGWEDCLLPTALQSSPTFKIDAKDVQLDIRSSEKDMTIWDGLRAAHHVFKCRLFLRCTTHPYDSVFIPDIRSVEMNCDTHPLGTRYARPPIFQAAYKGAAPGFIANPSGLPKVNLAAGIHMDRVWCKILNDDGTWGWYRDAFVPLSPRLFDKMEYREFKLVSRVWMGESCVEDELTFSITMLLREVDMR